VEGIDYENGKVSDLILDINGKFTTEFHPEMLSGVTLIKGDNNFTAVPYYSWANRGEGTMTVWLKSSEDPLK
jgi:ribulose 1,5-bisphosphate carboxylase large subunit-like protein